MAPLVVVVAVGKRTLLLDIFAILRALMREKARYCVCDTNEDKLEKKCALFITREEREYADKTAVLCFFEEKG